MAPGGRAVGTTSGPADASRAAHLAVAAELLNTEGPVGGGLVLRAGAVARAAGIGRSTLYRLWPSLGELADDVRLFTVTRHPDWRTTLLAHDPAEPLAPTVAAATLVDPGFVAGAGRTLAASSRPSPFRARAAADEAAWFEAFGAWLAVHLHAVDRRPRDGLAPADLAIALTTVTEGSITQAAMSAGRDRAFWRAEDGAALGVVLDRLLDRLTTAGRGDGGRPERPAAMPADPPRSDRHEAVLAAIARSTVDLPFDHPDAPITVRLVDLAALSRRLGVTERRLHQIWATPSVLNGDLFSFQAHRLQATAEEVATDVLMTRLAGGADLDGDVLLASLGAVIAAGSVGDGAGLFSVAFAVSDPHLSAVAEAEFAAWRARQRVLFLALLHAFGLHLGEDVAIDRFTWVVFASLIGAMRLALLSPELLDRRVAWGGADQPILAVTAQAVWASQVELCTHGGARAHG